MFEFLKYKPSSGETDFDLTFGESVNRTLKKKNYPDEVSGNKDKDLECVKNILHCDKNGDIILREFNWQLNGGVVRCFMVSCEGVANNSSINEYILMPLMYKKYESSGGDIADYFIKSVMPQRQVTVETSMKILTDRVNFGNAVIFIEGCRKGLVVDVKTWEHRPVGAPENESVVQGPHEGFNEVLRCNSALVRKSLNCSDLIMETYELGSVSKTPSSLAYIDGVINPALLSQIKKSLGKINTEFVLSSFDVEKMLEEKNLITMPQIITTERPDKVCRSLVEGRAALIVNGSSHVLILPSNITDIVSSPEDAYLRKPYSAFMKIIRVIAMILSLFTPGIYMALTRFHSEAILTDMLLAMAGARSNVPISPVAEILIMEISFELIKEACVRVPGSIGSSVGIVGGLILGQTAVSAGLVSPIVIIIVSICGISSFAIPSYSLSFAFRISRFIYIFAGAFFGMIGILGFLCIQMSVVLGTESFGVPMCVPFSPKTKSHPFIRSLAGVGYDIKKPDYLKPLSGNGGENEG